jgi:cytosine/adenosine deaminase-related metal-dependent hydrolase
MIYLLINAVVDTRDDSLPVAQALAIKDGRIVEVGGSDEILWLREDDYEVIDLEGRTVVPLGEMLAPGKPANFNVLDGEHTVEAWVEGVRRMVRP